MKPAKWILPQNKIDCLFCQTLPVSRNKTGRRKPMYPSRSSVRQPKMANRRVGRNKLDHGNSEVVREEEILELPPARPDVEFIPRALARNKVQIEDTPVEALNQLEANNLVKEMVKDEAEVVLSKLKRKGCLDKRVKITAVRTASNEFKGFFGIHESRKFAYCVDIPGLMKKLSGSEFNPSDWRVFGDGTGKFFDIALIHNGNTLPSVPIAYSRDPKETYANIKAMWEALKLKDLSCKYVMDLKMLNICRGLKMGWPNYPCAFCMWPSRDSKFHYSNKKWRERINEINPGKALASIHFLS